MDDLTRAVFPGFEEYHIYITYCLRTAVVGYILIRYRSLYTELTRWRIDGTSVLTGAIIFLCESGWMGIIRSSLPQIRITIQPSSIQPRSDS